MRCRQILWRIFFWVKRIVYREFNFFADLFYSEKIRDVELNTDYRFFVGNEVIKRDVNVNDDRLSKSIEEIKARILPITKKREFRFLNKSVTFPDEIEWQSSEFERLWLYNLHYFDYVFDLGIANLIENDATIFGTFKDLVSDWIDKNRRIGCGTGWEPYPVSLRIVNWIYAYDLFADKIAVETDFKAVFLKSIAMQAEFLCNNIERHVGKNHLIKNGKALFLAGMFFRGVYASKWKTKGVNILMEEAKEQILDDGGHYERSPMYHLIVLQDYLEMSILSRRNNIDFPVDGKLRKMLNFLQNVIHPDNQIPLFNDAAFGIAKEPAEIFSLGNYFLNDLPDYDVLCKITLYTVLLTGVTTVGKEQRAKNKEQKTEENREKAVTPAGRMPTANCQLQTLFNDSGFCAIRCKENDKFMIISCKGPSPYHSPGHSHSDMFSYELSLGDKRFIVDSGVGNYLRGEWRDYFRNARAHNTLTVNGQDQSEVWGTFGVARRARLLDARLAKIDSNIVFFEGTLKGFACLNSIYHQREIYFLVDQIWFVFDTIKADSNHLRHYNVESFIHVHPDRSVELVDSADNVPGVIIGDKCIKLHVFPAQISTNLGYNNELNLEIISGDEKAIQGWYSSEFGKKDKNSVIVISREGKLPMHIGYVLFPFSKNSIVLSALCKVTYAGSPGLGNCVLDIQITTSDRHYFIKKDSTGVQLKC